MNNKNSRKKLSVAVVAAIAVGSASVALVACDKQIDTGNTVVGHINVPSATIQAELGTYISPKYDVVNDYGLILAGYTVSLKSVTDESGDALQVTNNSVLVEQAGLYNFTYTAKSDRVKDATITIDFADRTAPTINFNAGALPSFFIKGNTYRIPSYTLSGDYVTSKCYTKVYHIADDDKKTETEVQLIDGDRFAATHASGKYRILIHVEDAAGNYNDYPYERDIDGPQNFVEHKVAYFDEEFGARQASVYEPNLYSGSYVKKTDAGAQVHGSDAGSYKVSFDGQKETRYNEGLVYIHTPAVIDLTEYESLEMWVYNETAADIVVGSMWWNDTTCKKGVWTKVTWSTRNWGGTDGNKTADNRKFIGLTDISGQTIRMVFDYGQKVIPNGNVYFSAMTATPKQRATVTAQSDNVILGSEKYYVGDTVYLSAVEQAGKSIDCFTLNGKPLIADNFVVSAEGAYNVDVIYKDGELTKDNMTWGTVENPTLEYAGHNDNVWKYKIGEGDKWVLSYDVYDVKDLSYIGLYVGGEMKLIGFELNPGFSNGIKFASYGSPWDKNFPEFNPSGVKDLLMGATQANPVTITYVRDGSKIKVFFSQGNDMLYFTTVNHDALGVDSSFGIGERRADSIKPHTYTNIRGVSGEQKVALFMAEWASTLQLTDCTADVGTTAMVGDWVTLTANPAPADKMFLHFTVDGQPISGNVMTVTAKSHEVAAVYADKSTLTLADGIITADGDKGTADIAKGNTVTLIWRGKAPAGKYCTGFKVDGRVLDGNVFTANGTTHNVEAVFGDKVANDNVALNEINKAGYVYPNDGYKPASVSYDTEVTYNGADSAVTVDGSVKVIAGSNDKTIAFDNALVDNLDDYKEVYFYIYTEAEEAEGGAISYPNSKPFTGSWWCNDTLIKKYTWTKVTFNRSHAAQNTDEQNIWEKGPKAFIYRIGNCGNNPVWVTPLYGVPYERSTVKFEGTGIATEDGKTVYNKEDEVKLVFNGTVPSGKIFDCFVVNGKAIGGDTFIAVEKQYTVSVKFASGYSDMTWGKVTDYQTEGNDAKSYKVGEGEQWVLRYDMTLPKTGWNYFGAYVGGTNQLLGVEMHSDIAKRSFGGYGGAWQQMELVQELPEALRQVLRNSSESPVRVVFVRQGDKIDMYIRHNASNQGWHVGTASFAGFQVTGNSFGIGERAGTGMVNGTLSNIEFVTGEQKVNLYRNNEFKNYGEIVIDRPQNIIYYENDTYTIPTNAKVANWLGEEREGTVSIDRVEDQFGERLTLSGTAVTLPYKGAQVINVVYKADGCPNKIVSYRLMPKDNTVFTPDSANMKFVETNGDNATAEYSTEQKYVSEAGSLKLTVKNKDLGNQDYAYWTFDFGDYDYIEFYAYTAASGKKIGCHWYGDTALTAGQWTKVHLGLRESNRPDYSGGKWIIRLIGFDAEQSVYISSAKLGKYTETKILDFSVGATKGTWDTSKKYDGNDSTVKDNGSLKLTPDSNDYYTIKINDGGVNVRDVYNYSELYFYVYTAASGAKVGIEWASEITVASGAWTKVTIPASEYGKFPSGAMEGFSYRIIGGQGSDFYITSLYGVKKA